MGPVFATDDDPSQAALDRADCKLCHQVPGGQAASRIESCQDCHVWIKTVSANPAAREKAMAAFPLWERYERNVHSYLEVPSLEAAMARLEPEWVEAYLADPHDLRPRLDETMPRFALTPEERAAIAARFAPVAHEVSAPDPARVETGRLLFTDKGCTACHTFGDLHTTGIPIAPDLQHTRKRMDPGVAVAWIQNPKAVSPAATMPVLELSDDEALALRDYVFLAELSTSAPTSPLVEGAALPATPTWEQVEERVFGRICAHCHMNPELNQGRAGPGNAGGFGYEATGIELQTYEGVVDAGPLIMDALERRYAEAGRDHVQPGETPLEVERPERPGMPLGLPPLPAEDYALVGAWIEAGMPR